MYVTLTINEAHETHKHHEICNWPPTADSCWILHWIKSIAAHQANWGAQLLAKCICQAALSQSQCVSLPQAPFLHYTPLPKFQLWSL